MKYGNKKVTIDGIKFDSKKEANRYCELKLMQRARLISNLEMQKVFELIPAQYEVLASGKKGKCIERAVTYKADFCYMENGRQIVEDTKGYKGGGAYAVFTIKRKLMLERYGIIVKET